MKQKFTKGMVIKNNIELAEILKQTYKKNNKEHIQALQKELKRYCEYTKSGHKYIITRVYKNVKNKIDGRKNKTGIKYYDLMDNLIINYLATISIYSQEINISFHELFTDEIELFTENYNKFFHDSHKYFAHKHNMSKGLVKTYIEKLKKIIMKRFETTLNNLQKNGLIEFEETYMLKNSINTEEKATKSMKKEIQEIEHNMYSEMNIQPFQRFCKEINKEYKQNVVGELQEIQDVKTYWKIYSIVCLKKFNKTKTNIEKLSELFQENIENSVKNKVTNKETQFQPYKYNFKHHNDLQILHLLFFTHYKNENKDWGEQLTFTFLT